MKYKNPANDYIEEVHDSSWLLVLLCGPFYWTFKGVWVHAVLHLVLSIIALCVGFYIGLVISHIIAEIILDLSYDEAILVALLFVPLMILTSYLMVGFTYAGRIHSILEKHYGRMGWVKVEENKK